MMEVAHPLDGDAVALRPCPSWCIESRHFADGGGDLRRPRLPPQAGPGETGMR
jgi:hypothetical protein